jgi:hypothetical protein
MADKKAQEYIYSDIATKYALSNFADKLGISIKSTLALIIRNTEYNDCLKYLDAERKDGPK